MVWKDEYIVVVCVRIWNSCMCLRSAEQSPCVYDDCRQVVLDPANPESALWRRYSRAGHHLYRPLTGDALHTLEQFPRGQGQ